MEDPNRHGQNRFRKTVSLLRKELPVAIDLVVRRSRLKGYDGLCLREQTRFLILINRDLDAAMAIETLLHEYAHARSWTLLQDKLNDEDFLASCHNAAWGVAYAEVYRCYEASLPPRLPHAWRGQKRPAGSS